MNNEPARFQIFHFCSNISWETFLSKSHKLIVSRSECLQFNFTSSFTLICEKFHSLPVITMGLNMFTCLSLLGLVTLINGRFIFPLSPIETSTGLSADYYLRGKPLSSSSLESSSSSPSIESKDDLESSHASPVGTRSSTGRSYERIQETTYQVNSLFFN